ncbi:MAG: archaeal heat shock protein Hsp14 [Candidatus Nitrosotenuis sp.]
MSLHIMGIVRHMAKEVAKEIGNKSREFYEFVLPPIDMYVENDVLVVVADVPGFDKKDIRITLHKNTLSIYAEKNESKKEGTICWQRPVVIDKKIPIPVEISDVGVSSAKLVQGVLTIRIPTVHRIKQISVE